MSNEAGNDKIHQPKVSMHAVHTFTDPGASQGVRRATEDAPGSAASVVPPSMEVVPHARRRHFSNSDNDRIWARSCRPLHQAWGDRCADAP